MDKNYKPNYTLAYYKHRDENGCYFSIHSPKTRAGGRQIPMTEDVKNVFLLEKRCGSGKTDRKRMHDSLPVLSKKSHCVFMDNELIINAW